MTRRSPFLKGLEMRSLTLITLLTLVATPALAQSTTAATPTQPATTRQAPRMQNVRLDLTITDTYTGTPTRKTVSMLVLMGESGMIRTSNRLPSGHVVGLNVDASLTAATSNGQMRARVTFEYTPAQTMEANTARAPGPAELHESLTVVVEDGKAIQISQSADPATDRKVTVELTATVVR
jgi:hypothetical protein